MGKKTKIEWLSEPEKHDYAAARSYLSLTLEPHVANGVVERLRPADIVEFAAKDVFRASGLPLLTAEDSHVDKDRAKIITGEKMAPLLLVRDPGGGKVVVADGYHRLCAVYTFDTDAMIPCKIV